VLGQFLDDPESEAFVQGGRPVIALRHMKAHRKPAQVSPGGQLD
jgi:hypothetical protein